MDEEATVNKKRKELWGGCEEEGNEDENATVAHLPSRMERQRERKIRRDYGGIFIWRRD